MWNAIGESLKIFFEKHLIPSVISIVSAIVAVLVLPTEYWMIEKIGKIWFLILVSGVVFLLVQLLIIISKAIRHLCYKVDLERQCREIDIKKSQEAIEKWLSFVDKLSPDDRAQLIKFLENGNEPEIEHGYVWHSPESIYNTNLVIKMKGHDGFTLIKLDDNAYRALKAIYEQRGSISHF